MGTVGRLFRRIGGQLDTPRRKTPRGRPGEAGCHAVWISPSWLQSVRSLADSGEMSDARVIVPVSALSPSIMTNIWCPVDQSNDDESRGGRPFAALVIRYFHAQELRGGM